MESTHEFASVYEREIETVAVFLVRRTMDVTLATVVAAEAFAVALCGLAPRREPPPGDGGTIDPLAARSGCRQRPSRERKRANARDHRRGVRSISGRRCA
jgi:hypothetical protein